MYMMPAPAGNAPRRFALIIPQQNLYALPSILDEMEREPGRLKAMQDEVCRVAPYFTWEWNAAGGRAMETTMQLLAMRLQSEEGILMSHGGT